MHERDHLKMPAVLFGKKGSRRDFLRNTAVTALAESALAACSIDGSGAQTVKVDDANHSGDTMAPNPAPLTPAAVADAMDKMHVAPDERYDVIVNCNNPGTWAFHRHILPHAESDHGMFGMVTALIVK